MTLNITIKNTSQNGKKAKVKFFDANALAGGLPTYVGSHSDRIIEQGTEQEILLWDTRLITVEEIIE